VHRKIKSDPSLVIKLPLTHSGLWFTKYERLVYSKMCEKAVWPNMSFSFGCPYGRLLAD